MSSQYDYDEYEEAEIARMRLSEQQTNDLNKVLQALQRVPVVRLHEHDTRKELLFTERLIVARTLVPVMEQVRENERRRQSQDTSEVEQEVLREGSAGDGTGGDTARSPFPS